MSTKTLPFVVSQITRDPNGERLFRFEFEVAMEQERAWRGITRALEISGCQAVDGTYDAETSVTDFFVVGTREQIERMQTIMATIDLD